jgi:hypothetical protein
MRRVLRRSLENKGFPRGSALAQPNVVRTLTLAFALALFGCGGVDADFDVADAAEDDGSAAEASPTDSSTADTSVPDDSTASDTFVADTGAEEAAADSGSDAPVDAVGDAEEGGSDATLEDATSSDSADAPSEAADDAASDAVTQVDAIVLDIGLDVGLDVGLDAALDVALPCDVTVTCWVDKDGDGYAVASAPVVACACPPGTANRDPAVVIDCNDENPLVHPGALDFHDAPYCVLGTACAAQSFDYDCSGAEEPQHGSGFAGCGSKVAGCPGFGWTGGVPACGGSGTFVTCKASLLTCDMSSGLATQLCR